MKKYVIIFLYFIIIIQNACTVIPSSISNEEFIFQDIKSLSIIKSYCFILKERSLGLPIEDVELEKEIIYHFEKLLYEYSQETGIEIRQVPDSIIQIRDKYILTEDIQQIIIILDDHNRAINNISSISIKSELYKYCDNQDSRNIAFWRIGGKYSTLANNILNVTSGTQKSPTSLSIQFGIIDSETKQLLWYCNKYSTLDPRDISNIECIIKSLFLDLKYGIDVLPESFKFDIAGVNPVNIYMSNDEIKTGNIINIDKFSVVFKNEKKNIELIELKDIRTIRNIYGKPIIYPKKSTPQIVF